MRRRSRTPVTEPGVTHLMPRTSISACGFATNAEARRRVESTSLSPEPKTGWVTQTEELAFYVFTEDGRNFSAMSNICTHLGCRVRWITDDEQFFCPCHSATFNKNGTVASGPPPRALDRFELLVEDEQLFVVGKVEA